MSRKRIVFLAEGATMAHFVRPLALAESLDTDRYEVFFCAPPRFSRYLQNKPFVIGELASMPGEQFLANIAKGAPLFPTQVLRSYVKQERELFANIRPDLVIGDMRLSLPVSAGMDGVLHVVIVSAYWSPYARRRSIIPSLPITSVISPRLLNPLYKLAEPLAYAHHVGPINCVREEYGLPAFPADIRTMYTEANYVLYADIPEFVPTTNLPKTHRYVGICPWAPTATKPEWWDRMRADPRPKVFVGLGSSGSLQVLPSLLRVLKKMPVSVLLSTSGRAVPAVDPAVYMADLLPLAETASESRAVVSHGGSSGFYPAIGAGTPVLGIPGNADQHLATAVLAESGAGLGVRIEDASEKRLRDVLEALLLQPQYRVAAQKWAGIFARYDSGVLFRNFVAEVLEGSQ
jgi:UDP:flavonoid glycosyltransferase YjiC (YdhE family)